MRKNIVDLTKKCAWDMYSKYGRSISYIAVFLNKAKSTIYGYIRDMRDEVRFPVLKAEIKEQLLCGKLEAYLNELSYQDVCCLIRKLNLWLGSFDRKSKINNILRYFKDYSILGLYPENLTRDEIKKAYFRIAKQTHPDMNKNEDRNGTRFKEVHSVYTKLMAIY